jgi:hypothetical protein
MRAKGPGPKTRVQLRRALRQRAANVRAAAAGLSLPHPNPWDALDPTKLPRDATPEQIQARYAEFRKLCPPPRRKQHFL